MMDPRELELYLHIPFCKRKCNYCDFVSFAGCEKQFDLYVEALCREIRQYAPSYRDREVVSIYIGGGTPSILDCGQISTLVDTLNREFQIRGTHEKRKGLFLQKKVRPAVEFSIEINPGTVDKEKLRTYRRLGINRLSIGLQSTDSEDLKVLGRIHTCEDFVRAYETAREVGFDNINVDLMQSIPGQTLIGWERVLAIVGTWKPEHISAYSLIVEEGTYFGELQKQGKLFLPEEETERQIYAYTKEFLEKSGYQRYEISNYAMLGFECRHNLVYWNRGEYLGVGCAAHSLLEGARFSNPSNLEAYFAGVREQDRQALTPEDEMEETLMLSTRTARGLDLAAWQERFKAPFERGRESALKKLEAGGFVERLDGRLRLTLRGMEVQDAVVLELLEAGE